jgi:cathepsin H
MNSGMINDDSLVNNLQFKNSTYTLPSSVDWSATVHVSRVLEQGFRCRACWAFTASNSLESAISIASNKSVVELQSVQYLVECDIGNGGCRGGWPTTAWHYIA